MLAGATANGPEERDAAARQVLAHAVDRDDALALLAMLGLPAPQRGVRS
jgi:hypothetical protein